MRTRLLAAFALVAVTGAIAFMISMRVMVPRVFDQVSGKGYGSGNGTGSGPQIAVDQHDAVVSAVNTSMMVALAVSLVCSAVIALLLSHRSLRSLDDIRAGTRRLAVGRYDSPVERPGVPELAVLADDINHLAATLAATEQHRAALIGDVAHEMRTPLTTINGYLEGFDDGLFTAEETSGTIRTEVIRLHQLARDLAAVSRTEEGQFALDRGHVDISGLIESVVARLRPQFVAAGVDLSIDAPQPLPAVIDAERMVQVLSNLIGNALAYTPSGGRVIVAGSADHDRVRLAVSDTGRGLVTDDLERIFERFYRADRHDRSGGTGIGLTISRAIVRAHGGELIARSPGLGRGSTFEVSIPAH